MGYYYKDKYSSLLSFDNNEGKTTSFYPEGIIIINNEEMDLDFADYVQTQVVNNILEEAHTEEDENNPKVVLTERNTNMLLEAAGFDVKDCLFKVVINYKDGTTDTLTRPSMASDKSWLRTKHKFNFSNENYFNLDPEKIYEWPTLDITLYNLYGFSSTIKVPFSLKKSSYNQTGIRLKLISANIRNDNKVAYTFLDLNTNQIILTSSN
jgi:hypothetical protein